MKRKHSTGHYRQRVADLDRLVEFWSAKVAEAEQLGPASAGVLAKRRVLLARVVAVRDRLIAEWTDAVLVRGGRGHN